MIPRRSLPVGTGPLLGAIAGALVGAADGLRVALIFGDDARTTVAVVALAVAVDALVGAALGAVVEVVERWGRWGRRVMAPRLMRAYAFLAAGAFSMTAAVYVVKDTLGRHNRILAAGLAALAALVSAILGALLAPAVARVFSRRAVEREVAAPGLALLYFSPAVAALIGGAIFLSVWRTPIPLERVAQARFVLGASAPALILPWALARSATLRLPRSWRRAFPVGVLGYLAVLAAAVASGWRDNLRFAPWIDIGVGAAILATALALAWLGAPWLPRGRGRTVAAAVAAFAVAAGLLLRATASEPARKEDVARAALVGPTLDAVRRLFDFDGDGYAGWFNGGDCDDHDPEVHPGAIDHPGDGFDDDCDGQDAAADLPPAAVMASLPASVPANLNLVFITIDTLSAAHLGCYGYARPTSPEIDRLAAEGTLFENGWAHAPMTRNSIPALASGRWPSAIDWDESIWWPRMARGVRTLAEALHDDGYFTAGLFSFSYFAAADRRGFERGMDEYDASLASLHVSVNGPLESRGTSSRELADAAVAFFDAHRDRRFFLWLHFYDPHLAYEPHPEVPSFGTEPMDLYDGEIRFTDLHVGRLLSHLKDLGLWDRTAVVLTGDHGEGFGEHGVSEHGFDLYAAQTRVPFIVRVPGLPAQRARVSVGHIDVAPTLVNLGRGAAEPTFFGRSLVPELTGARPDDESTRTVFQEVTSERGRKRALVTSTRHLIWNWIPNDTTECYDLVADPAEAHDLWDRGDGSGACRALKGELERRVAGLALLPGAGEKPSRGVAPPHRRAPQLGR
ncbi:MAG TPA: sulfatase [Polyangia bacterium]|nr:sulfatase [Polyangia bacterium]